MSHLPLDARAILEYLNELGYRNISAEQLKEFLKGMQPQSEISKSKQKAKNCSNPSTQQQQSPATTISATTAKPEPPQQRTPVKVIKCKKPLCHFKFYLDIRDHQLTKKIEDQIKVLGGSLEFFLTPSVTHFITDKTVQPPTVGNNNNSINSRPTTPQTPATPGTPQTPYSLESYDGGKQLQNGITGTTATTPGGSRKTRQSRADAILNRARRQSTTTNVVTATAAATGQDLATVAAAAAPVALKIDSSITQPYTVWQTEYSLRFFKKVQHELKQYLESSSHDRKLNHKSYTVEPINLKGGFIKIEALKRNYRPYYQLFKKPSEWPKIELTRDDGAFRLSPKKTPEEAAAAAAAEDEQQLKQKMTRKSRSRSSQRQHPLPSAVQALKKDDTGAKTSAGPQRNSAGACKQIKETSDKQCGVCEICKIEYDTLTIHLKTKDHEYFAKNSQNFIALDTLIHTSADVNKFLDENKKISLKPELEEMELAEDLIIDEDAADPLEDAAPLSRDDKRRSSGAHKTPSPSLREKSKRTTKGKHSSEKFQKSSSAKLSAKSATRTPVRPTATTTSPQKKPSSSMLELQRIDTVSIAAINMTTPSTRKKPSTASAISPPIRAMPMLPTSSMYKVVETQEFCSPARKPRDALGDEHQAVASPSLIVKFKKVRTTELNRLNGEAENFMFPKQRTSSELPTDVDRHTTSDHVRGASVSSASLDSTSELMDVENEREEQQQVSQLSSKSVTGKKAIATAKRRKGGRPPKSSKQSFPNAPIQPEAQLKRLRKPTTAAALVAATASITLPEATRKSSRTATAIVTAATTSSRLLRAAVEAAKNSSRLMATKAAPITSRRMTVAVTRPIEEVSVKRETMRHRMSVVKMEDRMGDYQEANTEESDDNEVEEEVDEDEDIMENDEHDDESDDEQDDDEDDDDDDDNDKDYVGGSFFKQRQVPTATSSTCLNASTREQRAAKRQFRKSEMMEEGDTEEEEDEVEEQEEMEDVVQEVLVLKTTPRKRKPAKPRAAKPKKNTPPQQQQPHLQDYSNSDRFHELRYAFERVPAADLWYRVFSRQDACEERYYEYFGSTKYRKLPYELGPIPFDRTLDGICCKLCKTGGPIKTSNKCETGITAKREPETANDVIKQEEEQPNTLNGASSPTLSGNTASSSQYTHKHKKLHLLQRYRQEQHDLLQKQQMHHKEDQLASLATALGSTLKCDSKASTPERGRVGEQLLERERERAESTHSNASSCASSTATLTKKQYRNKHLNKVAFLNLELPPRKSPREHASTLALVSCIIKQRQDSQSKSNSDMDEPVPTTPTTPTPTIKEDIKPAPVSVAVDVAAVRSPRNTRSAAATPVEELRFATEISENVKRLRRGQNKYDHSPPIVPNAGGRGSRGRGPAKSPLGRRLHHPQHRSQTPKNVKRRRRQLPAALHHSTNNKYHSYGGSGIGGINSQGTLASIRKTGSKKGVLEFDMDAAALKALDAATKHTNVRQLEWEIDKFMQLSGKDYDLDVDLNLEMVDATELVQPRIAVETLQTSTTTPTQAPQSPMDTGPPAMPLEKPATPATTAPDWNTPPPTDYFSSDFDLCDLFANARTAGNSEDDQLERKRKGFSLYNSVALHNYFRKRKNLKSNRTGWPKVQKKKSSVRQQQKLHQKIRFLQSIGEANGGQAANPVEVPAAEAKEPADQQPRRNSTVITPPDSEVDECDEEDAKTNVNDDEEEEEEVDDDDSQLDAFESIPEEEGDDEAETMLDDSNDEEEEEDDTAAREADVDAAADADEEEEDEGDADEDDDYDVAPVHKHTLRSTAASPAEKLQSNFLQVPGITTATSTPSTQMLRCGLRRTPQLNGSLGSCISPSEKAGDNSDIFTVSSDGLDTDMDMSNSHSQLNHKPGDDDHLDQQQAQPQPHHCPNHTPKRKFDLAKYASNNSASSTCAAEAATAAVKSLAISQFLKKEVRVTCRRLRAPFRRFRYRR